MNNFTSPLSGLLSPDFDGLYWGDTVRMYKYKYLTEDGKTKTSSWVQTRPSEFIKKNHCAILSYETKDQKERN